MEARRITIISILGVIAALLGLEGWLLTNDEDHDTISEVIQDAVFRWPVVALFLGLLMGHWVWPVKRRK
jgi:hypothetical protein